MNTTNKEIKNLNLILNRESVLVSKGIEDGVIYNIINEYKHDQELTDKFLKKKDKLDNIHINMLIIGIIPYLITTICLFLSDLNNLNAFCILLGITILFYLIASSTDIIIRKAHKDMCNKLICDTSNLGKTKTEMFTMMYTFDKRKYIATTHAEAYSKELLSPYGHSKDIYDEFVFFGLDGDCIEIKIDNETFKNIEPVLDSDKTIVIFSYEDYAYLTEDRNEV